MASIMEKFKETFGVHEVNLTISPAKLLESMADVAMASTIDGVSLAQRANPPDLCDFLKLWLTRTVNYLTQRHERDMERRAEEIGAQMEETGIA